MAYGQTGAGKTFTMAGDTSNYRLRGIIPRTIAQVHTLVYLLFVMAAAFMSSAW
ncbi:MAG: hypothetical protein GDA36_10270 [Rhodobacteraceae bacterium]|nr:hypothetical protein [Paracoccaceae bacterium]